MGNCRKRTGWVLAAALAGVLQGAPAVADPPRGGGPGWGYHGMMMGDYGGFGMMGPGMMMGGAGMGMMGPWGLEGGWGPELGLSDAQKKKLEALVAEAREAGRGDWQAMYEARQKMFAAMGGDKVDRAAATAAYRQMSEAMGRHMERALDFRHKLDGILTDKQRETLRDWHRAGWGCGAGPGRMMGR